MEFPSIALIAVLLPAAECRYKHVIGARAARLLDAMNFEPFRIP